MAARLKQNKKIFIETEYDNIVVVNPNEVYDSVGKREPRFVDQEDLVYYANLETFIIPRTKLAVGESFDVQSTAIATLFEGEDDLKINFLKPKGKTAFDSSWTDQITGKDSRDFRGVNRNIQRVVETEKVQRFEKSVGGYEDTQLLGINRISVTVKGTGVPEVSISMTDIQGRSLFEQGENSLYSAFFNFPYPLFYLTLKGYYGKAIRYRLSLTSFNAKFNAENGNYEIDLKLIGKFTALLFDTPLSYCSTSPYMYNSVITITDPVTNTKKTLNTYKGRQKLEEVYNTYKRKGLIPDNFPVLSLTELINRIDNFDANSQAELEKKGDFTKLNDIQDYSTNLINLNKDVFEYALSTALDDSNFIVIDNNIYYPYKKELGIGEEVKVKTKIDERIKGYVNFLSINQTFGTKPPKKREKKDEKFEIPITIKDVNDIIKKVDVESFKKNNQALQETFFFRTGKQVNISDPNTNAEFEKFVLDINASLSTTQKVLDANNNIIDVQPDYYFFGNKVVADGSYIPNSYLDKLDKMTKTLEAFQKQIEDELTEFYAQTVISPEGGLGFKPTIRNIFAVLLAGADTFYRLMEDVHEKAWEVRADKDRLMAVIPPESISPDAFKSIQTSSGSLNNDNVVYPWPLYFTKEKQSNQSELYVIQYPGDPKIIKQTRAFNYNIWPEIGFTETFLKAQTQTAAPTENFTYNNIKDVSEYISSNAIEFPFKTTPYQNLDAKKLYYEIFERAYVSTYYGNLLSDLASQKQVDKFYGDIESKNLSLVAPQDIAINQDLKNFKFNLQKLLDYMKKVSNNGQGELWNFYLKNNYVTPYIETLTKNPNEIYGIDTLSNRTVEVSSKIDLAKNLTDYLTSSDSSKKNTLDTYPFTNLDWLKKNLSNGDSIQDFKDYNDTTKTFLYLDDKKTIARINQTDKYSNIKLFTTPYGFNNGNQTYLTDQSNNVQISTRDTLKNFYINRKNEKTFFTESFINYGNSYSGNVGTSIQTTSLLNTPYFINSIVEGVKKQKSGDTQSYVQLGYLFLNSLPLITTKEKLINVDNNTITDLEYLAATFKKYSAVHQVPYAWVLKYGSIWHRYKTFVNSNVDILDDVWKDFDYVKSYDPTTSDITKQYQIFDYIGTTTQTISLQGSNLIVANIYDTQNVGFYPKLIDDVNYYLFGKDLFTGYTSAAFQNAVTVDNFNIGKNNTSSTILNVGFDTSSLNRTLTKRNYYQYRTFAGTSNSPSGGNRIVLYPSMGGIPIDQSIYECINSNNQKTIEPFFNKALYNGSVRSVWGASNFGYFDNSLLTKPKPTEYLKVIKTNTNRQNDFDLVSNELKYSSIDEIFSVFPKELLDKFEEKFLGFCKYNFEIKDLQLNDEVTTATYTNSNGVPNVEQKLLKNQISNLFVFSNAGFVKTNEDVDGKRLAELQISNLTESIKNFLNFDCVIKLSNPYDFERKLFNSFSNLNEFVPEDKYRFGSYLKGKLPGDGTNISLLLSLAQNPTAWAAVRNYVGFSEIPSVDYQNQVQPQFPSVPITNQNTPTQYVQPSNTSTFRTFQDLCTGQYFNITDPNNYSESSLNYTDGHIIYLETIDNSSQPKNFCARKVPNSAQTTTYNLLVDDNAPQTDAVGVTPESYCLSFFNSLINCTQSNNPNVSIVFIGHSSTILPTSNLGVESNRYFNLEKPNGGYSVYKIEGDPNFIATNVGSKRFYNINSNINDPNNFPLPSSGTLGANTNFSNLIQVNNNIAGNYIMVIDYLTPNGSITKLTTTITTLPGGSNTSPQQTNNPQNNTQPLQGTQKSFVSEFFIDNDIEFTAQNVTLLSPLIKLYVTQKIDDPSYNKTKFTSFINSYLQDRQSLLDKVVNETFSNLNRILKDIQVEEQTTNTAVNGDINKLSTYNTLKGFNDKWIAGSDLKNTTLFEDFLFMDRSNSDLGNDFTLDLKMVKRILDPKINPSSSLMSIISQILDENKFMFMAMPAYINFYGLQEALKNGVPLEDSEIGNSLFGTYLEVDYTKSSPKFLCIYMGNPSEYPKPKENSFIRFGDDSFDLGTPGNCLQVSDPNRNYSQTNRVVGFSVDFGIQNQSVFKGLDLDMSEMKNTSETFKINADLGSSVAGDQVAQQSVSLYSLYKSRSYSCTVESMGNVMIQPTMYFILRHVPMFYGPYWIFEVSHEVSTRGFNTSFKGSRIPKYSLPQVNNLLTNVNKKILETYKKQAADKNPKKDENRIATETSLKENPKLNFYAAPQDQCTTKLNSVFTSTPFVDIVETPFTVQELSEVIKQVVTDKTMRTVLMGIAGTTYISKSAGVGVWDNVNYNPYEISTANNFGALNSLITSQSCVKLGGDPVPIAKFNTFVESTTFISKILNPLLPMLNELVNKSTETNINKKHGKAAFQFAFATWITPLAYGPPPLTAQQIIDFIDNEFKNKTNLYELVIKTYTDFYEIF